MSKQKQTRTGCKSTKKLVTSIIEDTKNKNKDGMGLIEYRQSITHMSKDIKVFAVKLSPNLLSVKMALMGAVREVEVMMKERR